MSNRGFLVAGNTSEPPGLIENGINYNPDTEILAGSGTPPILWCALFEPDDFKIHTFQEYSIPTLVAPLPDAVRRFSTRRPRIAKAFPDHAQAIDHFNALLEGAAEFAFIKMDILEYLMMFGDDFDQHLRHSLYWFDTGDADAFQTLLNILEAEYDPQTHRLSSSCGDIDGSYFHGYGWVRPVPWTDS